MPKFTVILASLIGVLLRAGSRSDNMFISDLCEKIFFGGVIVLVIYLLFF